MSEMHIAVNRDPAEVRRKLELDSNRSEQFNAAQLDDASNLDISGEMNNMDNSSSLTMANQDDDYGSFDFSDL